MRTRTLFFCCALALAWSRPALAQFNLSSYVIAGGGGTATGGGWTLYASMGEAAAGTASGGSLTLTAGFLGAEFLQPPQLSIMVTGTNVVLSWPSSALGFVLQQNQSPTPVPWMTVPVTPTDNGVVKSVTLPITGASMYYRLAR